MPLVPRCEWCDEDAGSAGAFGRDIACDIASEKYLWEPFRGWCGWWDASLPGLRRSRRPRGPDLHGTTVLRNLSADRPGLLSAETDYRVCDILTATLSQNRERPRTGTRDGMADMTYTVQVTRERSATGRYVTERTDTQRTIGDSAAGG